MLRRRLIASAVAAVAAWALVGCTGGGGAPTPTPTPTVLTEDEAYADAEQAYRTYISALNSVDVTEPATFEALFSASTGRQNSFDRQQYSAWNADMWTQSGHANILWIDPVDVTGGTVRLVACLDTASLQVVDSNGSRQRVADGLDVATWGVIAEEASTGQWLVESTFLPKDATTCQAR